MIYLDNAATSFPKPEQVYLRIDEILRKIGGNPGRAGHRMALEAGRVVYKTREAIARLVNVPDASRIAFTKNATEAINIALKGILKPGDHVVSSTFEHNCVVKTLGALEKAGVEVTRVPPASPEGFLSPEDIKKAFKKNTKMVCVTHASNVFGSIQPIEEISRVCRENGVLLLVDGAQTAGAMETDMQKLGVDMFAATGHKSLFGPQGTGFLYVKEGIELEPLINGGTGDLETILEMPERLEAGTMNAPGIGGLGAGIEFVMQEGIGRIREHEEKLVSNIIKGLEEIKGVNIIGTKDPKKRGALVAFTMNKTPAEANTLLDGRYSIAVRCGTHCAPYAHRAAGTFPEGAVRVSPGYFTTFSDIAEFLRAIREISKS